MSNPREEALHIFCEASRGAGIFIEATLTLSVDAKYLLVRVIYRFGSIGPSDRNRRAVVSVVDMKTYNLISKKITVDPLIADSQWRINAQNAPITTVMEKPLTSIEPLLRRVTDQYLAAMVELPGLLASTPCKYNALMEIRSDRCGWTKPTISNVSDGYAVLVDKANVPSVAELSWPKEMTGDYMNTVSATAAVLVVSERQTDRMLAGYELDGGCGSTPEVERRTAAGTKESISMWSS